MIRTLIVDDEPPARRRLRALLASHPDVTVIGECGSMAEASRAITRDAPDLVLLDIAMPDGDGFQALAAVADLPPAVIFVTAHSGHAARAFDIDAVDYLVKPYHRERLAAALDRTRRHLAGAAAEGPDDPAPVRLPVAAGRLTRLLDPRDIDYLRAEGNYVRVYAGTASYLVRDSLADLVTRLGATQFRRVHRSFAVRLDQVREVEVLRHGELALRLRSGAVVISGRRYRDEVRTALGLPVTR